MTGLLWLGLVLCLLVVVAVGLSAYGSKRWTDTTRTLASKLEAGRIDEKAQSPSPPCYDSRELEGLPAPGEQWKPFTSRQRIVTRRPDFLWDAQMSMLPGLTARVVDSYIAGEGLLHAAILGLFTEVGIALGTVPASL